MYEIAPPEQGISQGDILDDCPIFSLERPGGDPDAVWEVVEFRIRVVVMTQACDLAQDKTTRVVVAVVKTCEHLVAEGVLKPSTIKDNIRLHKVPGFYFLPSAPSPIALPESIIDERDLHSVPKGLLIELAAEGKRLCRIVTPYREHLN